jgi:hypothetical protein
MKTRTNILGAAVAFLLIAAVSLSAGEGNEKWAKLKATLGLSDAQVTQLQQKFAAIQPQGEQAEQRAKTLHREIEELERAATPDTKALDAKRSELEMLHKEWHERSTEIFRSVLTKPQFEKFQQMKSQEEKERWEKEHKEKK